MAVKLTIERFCTRCGADVLRVNLRGEVWWIYHNCPQGPPGPPSPPFRYDPAFMVAKDWTVDELTRDDASAASAEPLPVEGEVLWTGTSLSSRQRRMVRVDSDSPYTWEVFYQGQWIPQHPNYASIDEVMLAEALVAERVAHQSTSTLLAGVLPLAEAQRLRAAELAAELVAERQAYQLADARLVDAEAAAASATESMEAWRRQANRYMRDADAWQQSSTAYAAEVVRLRELLAQE